MQGRSSNFSPIVHVKNPALGDIFLQKCNHILKKKWLLAQKMRSFLRYLQYFACHLQYNST